MKTSIKAVTTLAGMLVLGVVFGGSASACVPLFALKPAAYAASEGASLVLAAHQQEVSPIVGMWKFTFVSKGSTGIPDGTLIDSGYATQIVGPHPELAKNQLSPWTETDLISPLNNLARRRASVQRREENAWLQSAACREYHHAAVG